MSVRVRFKTVALMKYDGCVMTYQQVALVVAQTVFEKKRRSWSQRNHPFSGGQVSGASLHV
jgi:hypothetical protein